ncbi:DEAD/DEAH box helicase family protein [Methylobacterium bullatum]|uniref:ATP-dependent RNA helicase DbpA n=1 Tax=Methylobacterium bullatum TaxID=570505 RepID=A0A679JHG8_9HYPH|nr:ATP-dependent RNA helicase DbpA [Methylobacterium bullatum]
MRDFIIPALSVSISYDRGVGYFTSNWLRLAAGGLKQLAFNGGHARIIASPKLSREDCDALARGMEARLEPIVIKSLSGTLAELECNLEDDTLAALSWMVADGLLDFRIAVAAAELDGDFHDKFGVFGDGHNAVAFRGSPNDSERAFRNYESISAYYSWLDPREAERVAQEQDRFDAIWENRDPNLRVYDVPEAVRRELIEITGRLPRPYQRPAAKNEDRWRHQREAIAAFLDARRGVLEMATGTGKTRTALSILNELHARKLIGGAIVVAYGTDLLDQWNKELLQRTSFPVYRDYADRKETLSYLNASQDAVLLLSRQNLPKLLPKLSAETQRRTLLVFDEVHGMGSASLVSSLDGRLENFVYRLGLSATPERAYDTSGNDFVARAIGPVIFRFTLEQAISRGILCKFDYVALDYAFSDDDRAAVRQAIRRHHAKARTSTPSPVELLYQDLARIRKLSKEKLEPFREFVEAHSETLKRCLIFVETADYGALVQEILMSHAVDYHTYYGDDDRINLKRFANGRLECLVTCKRISEGIDISSVASIVLFSSARARLETVQRLGRCLRIDPDNPSKRALVVDFVRTDDLGPDENDLESTADIERRDWFRTLSKDHAHINGGIAS